MRRYAALNQGGFTALAFIFGVSFALSIAVYAYMEEYTFIFRLKREIVLQDIQIQVLHICVYSAEEQITNGLINLELSELGILTGLSYTYRGQNTQINCQVTSILAKNTDLQYVVLVSVDTQDQFLGESTFQTETVFRAHTHSTELEEVYTRKVQ